MIITALVFLIILSVLVLIHELGHFLVAKKFGIKVEEFGFGFPPRAFGIKKGETIYSINWLPIGGFVKLYGEDEAGAGRIKVQKSTIGHKPYAISQIERAFFAKSPMQRAAVAVAGVVMNAILAALIFYIFLFFSGFKTELPLLSEHKFFFVNQEQRSGIIVDKVASESPAEKVGITPSSKIISVNGELITNVKYFLELVNKNKGREILLSWEDLKTGRRFTAKATVRESPPKGEGALGVRFFSVETAVLAYETVPQKVLSGIVHPINLLSYNFDILGKLIATSIQKKTATPLSGVVQGPVGIYSVIGNIVQIPDLKERFLQVLNLTGILSISLAFFNILPIPALDGGRLFFILIEAATGRRVPQKFESYIHTIGMALLLTFIAFITLQDIARLF